MSTFYKLAVKEIIRETPEAISVLFQVPEELQANYRFVAGQYINLKLTLDGNEIRRAYSICATPESGELRIAIKSIKNGYFSKFANEQLTIGKVLEVGTPEGKFTFEPDASRQKNYAAFVAGSGITPVMSILQTVLEKEPNSTFVLVYGNKSSNETIFYNQLHDLQLKYVGRFFVHYVFSQQKAEDQLDEKRVESSKSLTHLKWMETSLFACPEKFLVKLELAPFSPLKIARFHDVNFYHFENISGCFHPPCA
mgnify:CR=1 FL=1